MTRNIYTPHGTDRFYDERNQEYRISENRNDGFYADNYYDAKYPERSLSREDRFIPEPQAPKAPRVYRAPQQKKSPVGLIMATIAMTLAVVVAVGAVVFFAARNNQNTASAPSTVVSTVASEAPVNAEKAVVTTQQTASDASPVSDSDTPAMAVAKRVYAGHSLELTSEENVILVDGERVYMDTKRLAPEYTGSAAHFNAYGGTSYGFDWTYTTDNCNFVISCNYNFARQQYDFVFYGTEPGTAHVTVYYNTDDNTQAPAELTLNVDGNLNVCQ